MVAPKQRGTRSGAGASTTQRATTTGDTAGSSQMRTASSAEYVVSGIMHHKLGVGVVVLLLVAGVVSLSLFMRARNAERAISSIAVLPFQNRSSDADSEYLSDGLAESLIYRLSQLPNLKVSPTSSVMRYKGKEVDVQKIASELGVDACLSGRIVQRDENLMISVELIDARNNRLLWGEQFERKMSELMMTQREIATAISQKLQLKLSGEESTGLTKRYTTDNEAYKHYLKGRYYWNKRTADSVEKGIEQFTAAVQKDPGFALAYAGLARSEERRAGKA